MTSQDISADHRLLARSPDDPNARPGLYTAIQEQLGLKLTPTKAPIQVMVIDHLETPSEN